MRLIDADKIYPDCMTKDGKLAISQSQLADAPTVENITIFCENTDEKTIEDLKAELGRVKNELRSRGEWIVKGQDIYCSICNQESAYNEFGASKFSNFCPNCGAEMIKGDVK